MKPVTAIVHCETFGFHPVMSYMAQAVNSRPIRIRTLVSTRPTRRPTRNMQAIVPRPRGPMDDPCGHHGITHQRLQIGCSITPGTPDRFIPTMKMNSTPTEKFRSRNSLDLRRNFSS